MENKVKLSKETYNILEETSELFNKHFSEKQLENYFFDEGGGEELWKIAEEILDFKEKELEKTISELKDKDLVEISNLEDPVGFTWRMNGDITNLFSSYEEKIDSNMARAWRKFHKIRDAGIMYPKD
ncbi:MAG: hypothetical protein ABEI78_01870, partial [Candidatus Nanohaloarchaea archaeon]